MVACNNARNFYVKNTLSQQTVSALTKALQRVSNVNLLNNLPSSGKAVSGGVKTAKNRRKRAKRKAKKLAYAPRLADIYEENDMDVISAEFLAGVSNDKERCSLHHAVQNHFFPDAGNFRGIADGSGNSALATYQISSTFSSSATNTWSTFSFAPTIDQTAANAFQLNQYTALSSAYNSALSGANVQIGGAFAGSNPSTDYRVVSATLRISPTGSFTNQAAEGKIAFVSDLSKLGTSTTTNQNWSAANIDNLPWSLPISGLTDFMGHWVPNDFETKFRGAGYGKNSAIVGYIFSNNANSTWRIDIKYVLEYFPTVAFGPYVPVMPPDMHPLTYYHFNDLARALYYPLIVGEYANWLKMYDKFKAAEGGVFAIKGSFATQTPGLASTNQTDNEASSRNNYNIRTKNYQKSNFIKTSLGWKETFARSFGGSETNKQYMGREGLKRGIKQLSYLVPPLAALTGLYNANNYAHPVIDYGRQGQGGEMANLMPHDPIDQ